MMEHIVWGINKAANALWWAWSQCINWWLWLTVYHGDWGKWSTIIKKYRDGVHTLEDVRTCLRSFVWTEDRWIDWFPWVHTIFAERFHDDCDGAAVYGGFLLSCIGVKSRRVKLVDPCGTWKFWNWICHAVQISESNKLMVSNNDLVDIIVGLDTEHFEHDTVVKDWKDFIRLYFAEGGDNYRWVI